MSSKVTQDGYQGFFTQFLDYIPCGIFSKDLNSIFLGSNKFLAQAAGFSNGQEMVGKSDYEMPWADKTVNYHEIDQEVFRSEKTIEKIETIQLKNKKIISNTVKAPLYEDGKLIGLIGAFMDITELVSLKEKAELAIKAKEELLYNLRHDIRTPFAGMRLLLADYLRSDESDSTECHALHLVHQTANELFRYMDKILELTEVEAAEVPVVSQSVNLKALGKQCADMHLPVIKEKGLQFFYDYDDRLPEQLFSDGFRLKRILINLFGNAVKFTDKGYIRLSIMLESDDPASDNVSVALSVQDTGVGIPEDKKTLIFGKFEQLNPTNEGKYKGSGFGLFAVRLLASELGGEVKLKSVVEDGSTFTCHVTMKKHAENKNTLG